MEVTHPLQTREWEEFKKSMGVETTRENGWLITWHKLEPTPWKIGYMAKSKLPNSTDIGKIRELAKTKNAIMVRLEPDVIKMTNDKWKMDNLVPGRHLFTPTTFCLDLTKTEDELLAAMHSKARYNIRLAQKKGVIVKEDNSHEAFERYLELTFGETTERQKFYAHNRDYHRTMWKHLHPSGIAHLFTATYEGKILVTWIVFKWQDKLYFPYGASSHEHKEVQAPSLMLWETARWGKSQGCKIYDLWGAEEGRGFNTFKERFGPSLVETVGTWDLVVNPLLYPLYRLSEEIRWKILRLLK
jgi:lipid II:glycine glycyltransferase (peptidoglycan interpeptide bridge formation enzyme)